MRKRMKLHLKILMCHMSKIGNLTPSTPREYHQSTSNRKESKKSCKTLNQCLKSHMGQIDLSSPIILKPDSSQLSSKAIKRQWRSQRITMNRTKTQAWPTRRRQLTRSIHRRACQPSKEWSGLLPLSKDMTRLSNIWWRREWRAKVRSSLMSAESKWPRKDSESRVDLSLRTKPSKFLALKKTILEQTTAYRSF